MGNNPVAELRHIHKVYGSGDTEVRAVNDLNLTVEAGDYIAVMGASGSGKSTAMNILGCLDRPSSGSYLLQGQQVDGLSVMTPWRSCATAAWALCFSSFTCSAISRHRRTLSCR